MAVVTTSGTYTDGSQEAAANLPGNVTPVAINNTLKHTFANGSAADQVQKIYAATLAFSGSPIVLNLFDNTSGTQVTDLYGVVFAFTAVRKIFIKHKGTTDAQPLKLGYSGSTANAWTAIVSNPGQIFLQPSSANNDGGILLVAPNTTSFAVNTGSKLLQLDPGANTFNADIVIVGT